MRIHNRWYRKGGRSLQEIAGALGFIAWRIAANATAQMFTAGFEFGSASRRLDVMAEFLAFLVQVTDRLVHEGLTDDERQEFVTAFALHLVGTMADNRAEGGEKEGARETFIELLNRRGEEYAEFSLVEGQPSYPFLRCFAGFVEASLGNGDTRWALEQVMEIEAPEAVKTLKRGLDGLFKGYEPGDTAAPV